MSPLVYVIFLLCIVNFIQCKEIEIWNRIQQRTWIGAHANKGHKLPDGGGWQLRFNQKVIIL